MMHAGTLLILTETWTLRWDGNAFECIDAGSFEHHLYVARMSLMNVLNIWIFICMLSIIYFFLIWAKWIFLWVHLDRQKKTCVFLCVYFFFLCGLTHRKISFNLGEHNFSVRARPTEKLFLTVNPQKNWIFLSLYFCGYFSEGTPSEKYFSDGIRIFPWVFAPSEKIEIPVVNIGYELHWTGSKQLQPCHQCLIN